MQYSEYLNSARKHQYTCQEILNTLQGIKQTTGVEKSKRKQLQLNLYYLSGYIIECSIKYAIYHLLSYDRKKCVKQLDQDGISFKKDIKHHKFDKYADYLRVRQPGILLIDDIPNIEKDVISISKLWDAEVRYWFNDIDDNNKKKLSEKNIIQFFKLATNLMKQVERI